METKTTSTLPPAPPAALSKHTVSFGLALAVASVANALLTVVKEKNPAVLAAMKRWTGHHWVTHVTVIVLLFFVTGWSLGRLNGGRGVNLSFPRLLPVILAGVLAGGGIIVGFYLFGD